MVDDDKDFGELLEAKLQTEGHETFVINTGEGAFEYAKKVKPDICILDIMLPTVTGYQICRRIRRDPELYKISVLMVTALMEEPEIIHGLEQGADDYLAKPFKLERLMDKLASLITLSTTIESRNRITGLPGTEAIKQEINHQLARDTAIAVLYIDMVGFKPYCASRGAEGQKSALQFMAKLLNDLNRAMGIYETFVAHMGGEHFVVLLRIEDHERFAQTLTETFHKNVKGLYTPAELEKGYIMAVDKLGKEVRCPPMALFVGVVHTGFRRFKSAKKIFAILAQVRKIAEPRGGSSVVFVDRRRADR